jgi:hypothetical protein
MLIGALPTTPTITDDFVDLLPRFALPKVFGALPDERRGEHSRREIQRETGQSGRTRPTPARPHVATEAARGRVVDHAARFRTVARCVHMQRRGVILTMLGIAQCLPGDRRTRRHLRRTVRSTGTGRTSGCSFAHANDLMDIGAESLTSRLGWMEERHASAIT